MREFTEQELVRREKLQTLIDKGINPFGSKFVINNDSANILRDYAEKTKEELLEMNMNVTIAGRIMTKRGKGKAGFMHIQDKSGLIQVYVRQDIVGDDTYELFEHADLGDIVGITGILMRTNAGELSIKAKEYTHLVKALRPLPEKFHGLTDVEERFRRKYVDLIMNEGSRKIAFLRPKIIRSIQNYLDNFGYTEVETPILSTILGGASARPFVTHHNTLDINMYLRIATELDLKRLIVGGMDAVYEIGRLFRNEGMDKNHNPEFTTIEVYKAYSDLDGMMDLTEGIIGHVVLNTLNTYDINWKGHNISLKPPFKRIHMVDAIKEATGINFFDQMSLEEAKSLAKKHQIELEDHFAFGHIVNAFFEMYVEESIIQPTFVTGHPIEISPLARKSSDERFTERFELFIAGDEYANAFTELNDPIDQYERFENQMLQKELGNEEANEMDLDFVEALEYGMPPTGGMGMGIDRLVMMITGSESIREVILFPTMKPIKK